MRIERIELVLRSHRQGSDTLEVTTEITADDVPGVARAVVCVKEDDLRSNYDLLMDIVRQRIKWYLEDREIRERGAAQSALPGTDYDVKVDRVLSRRKEAEVPSRKPSGASRVDAEAE